MKSLWLALAFALTPAAYSQVTSPFTLYVHDTTGANPDTVLPPTYQLPSTPVGGNSATVIKMVNTSTSNVNFVVALVSTSATSSAANPNFSVTGLFQDQVLVPGASVLYTVNFRPVSIGALTGYLNLAFQIQQNGCVFSGNGTVCPSNLLNASTLTGAATPPQLTLAYQTANGPVVLSPASSSPLNFPNTSLSATSTIVFILANASPIAVNAPAILLPVINTNAASAFSLDASNVPATINAGGSATFTVTFAPSQTGLATGQLQVGSNIYPIQGAGIIVANIDALQISYTNSTGIRSLPQAATPISFGQVLPSSGASAVLTFNILNPITSANAVTVPAITISGNAFSLAGLPAMPVTIAVGNSITFTAAFTPVASGTFTGSLAIGARTFSLTGLSVASAIPGFSITTSGAMASQQQLSLTVQLSAPSPVSALGTISMQFTPSVTGVADDPAVQFLATGGRVLNISLASGAQTATYNNQSAISFQTGTTAGTINFSVAFPDTTTYNQSFNIPAALVQFTSVQALRENPNLIVTINGYDNTYTAGQLSFTFYDTTGKVIGNAIPFNAGSDFQNLFYTNNQSGGMFSLQAAFPVTKGDITQVGSVTVSLANSVGSSSTSIPFQ